MLNTSAKRPNEGTTEYYGHADYNRDKAAGMSDAEIKRLIDADPSKMATVELVETYTSKLLQEQGGLTQGQAITQAKVLTILHHSILLKLTLTQARMTLGAMRALSGNWPKREHRISKTQTSALRILSITKSIKT